MSRRKFINICMKIADFVDYYDELISILLETNNPNKTSFDTFKQIRALNRKYDFDTTIPVRNNFVSYGGKIPDKFKAPIEKLVIEHVRKFNSEIYKYISENYKLKAIYWKSSESTISQYVYFVLPNKQLLCVRVSDHEKPENKIGKTPTCSLWYHMTLNDVVKQKIDNFIKEYSNEKSELKLTN